MKRFYAIEWYPTKEKKYGGTPVIRITVLALANPTGRVEFDAKNALALFAKSCGNLKKNTIIKIKEFDENRVQIGEDIVPTSDENSIIPIAR